MLKEIPILGENKMPNVQMRAELIPSWRAVQSLKRGTLNKAMALLRGGLGDEACAEPSLRFALNRFTRHRPDFELSVISKYPTLWRHLAVKQVFDGKSPDLKIYKPDYQWTTNYPPAGSIDWEFYCVPFMNTVDQSSISMWKCMLHQDEKDIRLVSEPAFDKLTQDEADAIDELRAKGRLVLLHPGLTWPSRTLGKAYWQKIIDECRALNIQPVLIGAQARDNVGTEEVDPRGCIDIRDRCTLDDTLFLCQRATALFTNDSAPMHLAASTDPNDPTTGKTWIGFVATIRHPSHISHWRRNDLGVNEWNWREVNLGSEEHGLWNHFDYYLTAPDKAIQLDTFGAGEMVQKILPEPRRVAEWLASKLG